MDAWLDCNFLTASIRTMATSSISHPSSAPPGQTADVSFVSKPMRRIGSLHCILAYLFNTTVLALLINIGAGMF